MPFLRFSKDRRGYESTFLLHAARRRGDDKDAPGLLYWFRTPPHIKIGRAAFDEETVRALEDQHPDVEFDWTRILAARALSPEPVEVARPPRRPGRHAEPRFDASAVRPTPAPPAQSAPAPFSQAVETLAAPIPLPSQPEPLEEVSGPEVEATPPARRFVRVFDAPPSDEEARPEPEPRPHPLSDPSAAERAVGSEQLSRLRGQHAAALARIGSRITDPVLAESLRTLAERANPDVWVTDAEVRSGLAGLREVYTELTRHLGRRRGRRRVGRGTTAGGID